MTTDKKKDDAPDEPHPKKAKMCSGCGGEVAAYWCHSCAQPVGHNCKAQQHASHVVTTGGKP